MANQFFSDKERSHIKVIAVEEINELIEKIVEICDTAPELRDEAKCFDEMARHFHTITGSAGIAGFADISEMSMEAEKALKSNPDVPFNDKMPSARSFSEKMSALLAEHEKKL